jgi:hypothetical protein
VGFGFGFAYAKEHSAVALFRNHPFKRQLKVCERLHGHQVSTKVLLIIGKGFAMQHAVFYFPRVVGLMVVRAPALQIFSIEEGLCS